MMLPLAHGILGSMSVGGPASIFQAGDLGEFWDFTDPDFLYQDELATSLVTTSGDPIKSCLGVVNSIKIDSGGSANFPEWNGSHLYGSNASLVTFRDPGPDVFSGDWTNGLSVLTYSKRGPTVGSTYAFIAQHNGSAVLFRFYTGSSASTNLRGGASPLNPCLGVNSFNCFGAACGAASSLVDTFINGTYRASDYTAGTSEISSVSSFDLFVEPDYEIAGALVINRRLSEEEMAVFYDYYQGKGLS